MTTEELKARQSAIKVGSRVKTLVMIGGGYKPGIVLGEASAYEWNVKLDDGGEIRIPKSKVIPNACVSTNPIVCNAMASMNGIHFSGGGNALAEKIVLAVQKYIDAKTDSAKDSALAKVNELSRAASTLAGGAWVMRDGSVALTDKQPRGATRLTDFISLVSTNSVVANAVIAKNGKFGFDPAVAVALKSVKNARVAMQNARLHIGSAEDDDEAPGQARDMEKIIKDIDNLIGWLKDYA